MSPEEQRRRDMILVSALLHTSTPKEYVTANCHRVLKPILLAEGLWSDAVQEDFGGGEKSPIVDPWYGTLIALTRQEPESERLLEGAGNLSPAIPAGAHFTACWLTPAGEAAARQILQEHPDWEARLRPAG